MFNGALKQVSGGKILDVGTGGGQMVKHFIEEMKEFTEIIGIDSNEAAIETAKSEFKKENVHFMKMDASNITFEDGTFDTVCISNTLHHLEEVDMYKVLREMKRVLKPNGLFIICEMYSDNQNETQMGHVLFHHFSAWIGRLKGIVHNDTFKREEIIEIIKKLGLRIINSIDFIDDEKIDDKETKDLIDYIDKTTEKFLGCSEYDNIKHKGEEVKDHLLKTGFSCATELVVLCK